jgi:Zn-dependent metalloprotease
MMKIAACLSVVGRVVLATTCVAVISISTGGSAASAKAGPGRMSVHTRVDRGGAATFLGGTAERPLTAPRPGDPEAIAEAFGELAAPLHDVDPASDLVAQPAIELSDGGAAVRLQQEYAGIPVLAGEISVRLADDGSVLSSSGEVARDVGDVAAATAQPAIDVAAAAATAIAVTVRNDGVGADAVSATQPELMIYEPELLGVTNDRLGARPVWRVEVRTEIGDVNRFVLVDASSGAVALTFSSVHAAADIRVCDNAQVPGASLNCNSPVRSTANNVPSPVADVNDAYLNSLATYNFYSSVLGRDSIDDAGMPIRSTVRFCPPIGEGPCPFANAFWNGEQMVYGTGYASADDVVAHELTHGVTDFESGLLYYAESGAINESLSDVFGELIDQWNVTAGDAGDVRWELGEDIPGGAIRNMSNPPAFNDPDKMTSPLYHGAESDEHGVHINSGVNNKAAFLMTDGGTFNSWTITALGATKTAKIYYEAQTALLTPGSDYRDLAAALQQACENLIGSGATTSGDCAEVADIVTATEMELDPTTPGAKLTAPVCPSPGQVANTVYEDDFETTSSEWLTASTTGGGAWFYTTDASQSGARSFAGPNLGVVNISELATAAPIPVPATPTFLRFDHSFSFEASIFNSPPNLYWDGGVVEYSTNGTTWLDITTLGGGTAVNGYNATLFASGANPLRGRAAFGGNSPAFQSTRYNISSLGGQNVRFRFRIGTDISVAYPGWFVDDFSVYTCGGLPIAPSAPGRPTGVATTGAVTLQWTAPASTGGAMIKDYVVEQSSNGGASWTLAPETVSKSTAATISGLANSTEYVFRVAAVNSQGAGGFSPASDTLLPAAAPSSATIAALPPTLRIPDGTPARGQSVALNRGGFMPSEWVVFAVGSPPRVLGTTRASGTGVIAGNVTIPTDLATGDQQLAALGLTSGAGFRSSLTVGLADDGFAFPTGSGFTAVAPTRVFDTRPGEPHGTVSVIKQQYGGGTELRVRFTGTAGVPLTGVSAVSLNLTAVAPVAAGFVTAYPCGSRPVVSSLNFVAGDVIPNAVIAPVSPSGEVCFFSSANTHLLADINGWFANDAGFTAVSPTRLFDSRPEEAQAAISIPKQRYGGGTELRVKVTGVGNVPTTGVAAVSLNVVAINPDAPGFVTVYPCGPRPLASSLNYVAGQVVPNAVIAPVSASGEICLFSTAGTHLLADVNGWFAGAAGFVGLAPVRVFDSRQGEPQGAIVINKRRYGGAAEIRVQITGVAGLPNAGVGSVSLNVTAVNPATAGFITVYPCGTRPLASSLNFVAGQIVPNAVIAPVSAGGEICFFSSTDTDILADINGWLSR